MDKGPLSIAIPLFESDEPVTAAVENRGLGDFKAVVSTDGTDFWLHETSDLSRAVATGDATIKFGQLRLYQLPSIDEQYARNIGLDVMAPDTIALARMFHEKSADLVVTSVARGLSGNRVICAFADQSGAFNAVRDKWVCTKYGEIYAASYGGVCPEHPPNKLRKAV